MAVYKVPQDVEADDKLIGPFSFRQFVFILVMIGSLYATYLFFSISPLLVMIPLPIAVFFGILGLWPRKDQPIEIYLAALLHFWTSPRKKIWDQEGHIEHVHINVPHKEVPHYTDGLQTYQVKSRLHNLAATLDSRGWAAKNLEGDQVPRFTQQSNATPTDRLIMPQLATDAATAIDNEADVLDAESNPIGQNFQQMVDESESLRQEQLREQFQQAAAMSANGEELDDQQLNFNPYPDMQQSMIQPGGSPQDDVQAQAQADEPQDEDDQANDNAQTDTGETAPANAILNLANNSDLNVSTIARQAEQAEEAALNSGDTIELH